MDRFYSLSKILSNDDYFSYMLKAAVNKGASILHRESVADNAQ